MSTDDHYVPFIDMLSDQSKLVTEQNDPLIKMDSPEFRSIDDVIGEVTFNKFHYVLLCLCGLGLCVDAMEVTSLSFINPCAGAEFALSDDQIAVRVNLSEFVSLFLLYMSSRVLYVFSMQGLSGKVSGFPFPLQFNSTH